MLFILCCGHPKALKMATVLSFRAEMRRGRRTREGSGSPCLCGGEVSLHRQGLHPPGRRT